MLFEPRALGRIAYGVAALLIGTTQLVLADIGNLALNKVAEQSSTLEGGKANNAVDGNTEGTWVGGSVTQTQDENGTSWWAVDLGEEYILSEITVWNRTDIELTPYQYFRVITSSDNPVLPEQVVSPALGRNFYGLGPASFYKYPKAHLTLLGVERARFVTIGMARGQLSLAEVQVKGAPVYTKDSPDPGIWSSTAYLDKNIINSGDPSALVSVQPNTIPIGISYVFDRRFDERKTIQMHFFEALMNDGQIVKFGVSRDDYPDKDEARRQADIFARILGQLPYTLRKGVKNVAILKGNNDWGGLDGEILIHTEIDYVKNGTAEEMMLHEAVHAALDELTSPGRSLEGWSKAQAEDPQFISTYAKDHPKREDLAESFLVYYALRHRGSRISADYRQHALNRMSARIRFLDKQNLHLGPEKGALLHGSIRRE